jgi:SAM-dependent methyltransferase
MARDLDQVSRAQQALWAQGDFHRIGVSQVVVGELLVRALRVHAGERVLDVAGGSGNTALAAARRWAEVTCTDYVPALLEHARERAAAERLPLRTEVADAQQLPFPDSSFDVVTSTFGAMFAPDQEATASELMRVLRPGGRLGMSNWTPDSWVGELFRLLSRYVPPPAGVLPPAAWGTLERLENLIGGGVSDLTTSQEYVEMVHYSPTSLFQLFKDWFGPMSGALARLDDDRAAVLTREFLDLTDAHNVATDGTCDIPSTYLQVVAVKRS